MHGIVSLLPEPYYGRVLAIWDEFEDRYGLSGIRATPYPHFSWQIGQDYPSPALESALQETAAETAPLVVTTAGLGLFTGASPMLYIPVVKTASLAALHGRIWKRFSAIGAGVSSHYSPNKWAPHISLAQLDNIPANIGAITADLAVRYFTWEMRVDNIAFIDQPSGKIGELRLHFSFS